jgi:diguanylate cyclase (GGDEF)-like protein
MAHSDAAGPGSGGVPVALGDIRADNLVYATQLGQGIGALRFMRALETHFREDHAQRSASRMRVGFYVAIGLYVAFLTLRVLTETGPAAAWGLALRSIIIGTMLSTVLLSYREAMQPWLTPLVALTYVVFGVGVTAIEVTAHHFGVDRHYEGLVFVTIHCFVFSNLLIRQALATTLTIYAVYAIGGSLGGLAGKQFGYELFFLLLINVMGAVARYLIEYSDRENFLRRQIIREMVMRDGLTGLFNRSAFIEHFERVLGQAVRERQSLALVMLDLDSFKQYNDRYGHLAGDQCLRSVAQAVGQVAKRPLDMLARYGGEEFIGVWYAMPAAQVAELAESIRRAVADLRMAHAASPHGMVTASVGALMLSLPTPGVTAGALIDRADAALYEAKAGGRNRVVVVEAWPGNSPAVAGSAPAA